MTPALATTVAILGVIFAGIPIYYLARSNAREAKRMREADTAREVAAAVEPLQTQLADRDRDIKEKDRLIDMYQRRVEARDRRIEQLEDELRRAGRDDR